MKKRVLISVIFLSFFAFFLVNFIDKQKDKAINDLNEDSILTAKATYSAVIDTYEMAASKDFNFFINRPKVIQTLHAFKDTQNLREKNILRGELYRLLYKSYNMMQSHYVRDFQLHTHDAKSLLRMLTPYENGDSLLDLRKSIYHAYTQQKNTIGFEGGRTLAGYRYVYPILDKGEYLGSVEFSISFEGIQQKLEKLMPNYTFGLLIKKDESYDKAFNWNKKHYRVSAFDEDYYEENSQLSKHINCAQHQEFRNKHIKRVIESANFKQKLQSNQDFFIPIICKKEACVINFIAFVNTENKHAGYIVYFGANNEIVHISNNYRIYKIVALLVGITFFILLFIIIHQIEKLRLNKNKLQTINTSLYNAQKIARFASIEYDTRDKKYYLSEEVYNLLGLDASIFKPSYKAFASIIHPNDRKIVATAYRNFLQNTQDSQIKFRVIKRSNEIIFIENHLSYELNQKKDIIKIISVIYDTTEQMNAYKKLEKFVNFQSSIVVLTDGIEFQFANKSFYNFFGFEDLSAFKSKYSCICERFIQNNSFFSLVDVKEGEKHWIESLLNLSMRQRVVSMFDSTATPYAFNVLIKEYDEKSYVVEFIDISDSMIEKLQLEKQLNRDQLTGAHNRVYFETHIENVIKSNKNANAQTAIVFIDIDHFKNVNDTYGHDAGDEVLISLVKLIKEQIRETDYLIRWGGEEFIILARAESQSGIVHMCQKIRVKIQNHKFGDLQTLTCSFGIAIKEEKENIKKTITRADMKLYEAKESGRNQVQI